MPDRGRSALATDSLQRMGFTQLMSLEGDSPLKDAGLPVQQVSAMAQTIPFQIDSAAMRQHAGAAAQLLKALANESA